MKLFINFTLGFFPVFFIITFSSFFISLDSLKDRIMLSSHKASHMCEYLQYFPSCLWLYTVYAHECFVPGLRRQTVGLSLSNVMYAAGIFSLPSVWERPLEAQLLRGFYGCWSSQTSVAAHVWSCLSFVLLTCFLFYFIS